MLLIRDSLVAVPQCTDVELASQVQGICMEYAAKHLEVANQRWSGQAVRTVGSCLESCQGVMRDKAVII